MFGGGKGWGVKAEVTAAQHGGGNARPDTETLPMAPGGGCRVSPMCRVVCVEAALSLQCSIQHGEYLGCEGQRCPSCDMGVQRVDV